MSVDGFSQNTPTVRILLVGDCGSGKGALARQLCYGDVNAEPDTSSGCELHTCVLMASLTPQSPPEPVFVELVVAPGYRKNESLRAPLYGSCDAVVVVYDTRGRRALRSVPLWRAEVEEYLMEKDLWQDPTQSRAAASPIDLSGETFFGPNGGAISRNIKNFGKKQNPDNPVFPVALLGIRWGGREAIHTTWPNNPFLGPYFECLPDPLGEHEQSAKADGSQGGRGSGGAGGGREDVDADVELSVRGDGERDKLLMDHIEAGTSVKNAAVCISDLVSLILKKRRRYSHDFVSMHAMQRPHSTLLYPHRGGRDGLGHHDDEEHGKESGKTQKSGILGWVSSVSHSIGEALGLTTKTPKPSLSRSYSGNTHSESSQVFENSRLRTNGEYTSIRHRSTSGTRDNPNNGFGLSRLGNGNFDDDEHSHVYPEDDASPSQSSSPTPRAQHAASPAILSSNTGSSTHTSALGDTYTHTQLPQHAASAPPRPASASTAASDAAASDAAARHAAFATPSRSAHAQTLTHAQAHAHTRLAGEAQRPPAAAAAFPYGMSQAPMPAPLHGRGGDAAHAGYGVHGGGGYSTTSAGSQTAFGIVNPGFSSFPYSGNSEYGVLPEGYDVPQYNLAQIPGFTVSTAPGAHPYHQTQGFPTQGLNSAYATSQAQPMSGQSLSTLPQWRGDVQPGRRDATPSQQYDSRSGSTLMNTMFNKEKSAQYYEDNAYSGGSLYD